MNITVDSTSIAAAIAIAGFTTLAEVLAPVVVATPFVATSFCQGEPPTAVALTQQDIQDVSSWSSNPLGAIAAAKKVNDWFWHWYWWQICE